MDKKDIFKHLKVHYNYVVDKKYNILFIALQGSQNYNLDDENSNVDSIAVVLPNYDDIVLGNVIKSTTLILPNNEHIDIIDIRNIIEQWKNQNTHFLQILFTDYKILNKQYKEHIDIFFKMNEDIAKINNDIMSKECDLNNNDIINNMYYVLKTIINKFVKNALDIKFKKLDLTSYKDIYVTSDTHFGHINILKYEDRNLYMNVNTIEEHDAKLIENWNNIVTNKDLVIILGDFSFYKAIQTMNILDQLNGDKLLIKGNHDCIYLENKIFDKMKFIGIYDYLEISYKKQKICLMHYPIMDFKHMHKEVNPYILIHGHIHKMFCNLPKHAFNAGVDVNNYYPVKLEKAIEKALDNKHGRFNVCNTL